jgi:flagellar hook-basal body complex protein FliE
MASNIQAALQAYKQASSMQFERSDAGVSSADQVAGGFRNIITDAVQSVRNAEVTAENFVAKKVSANDLVSAVTQADLQLRTLVSVRDRFVAALQEIIRMPV